MSVERYLIFLYEKEMIQKKIDSVLGSALLFERPFPLRLRVALLISGLDCDLVTDLELLRQGKLAVDFYGFLIKIRLSSENLEQRMIQ